MKVAVALITDLNHRILITQRPHHVPHGGFWEFPGGKLEVDESAEDALVREIREEVGLSVMKYKYIDEISHQYPDKTVQLVLFHVTQFSGVPSCLEGQLNMKWVALTDLDSKDFPDANHKIVEQLPSILERIIPDPVTA